MKRLTEKDISKAVTRGMEVMDGAGKAVFPFKFERETPKPRPPSKLNLYFAQILAGMRESLEERKATRAVLEKIAAALSKPPAKKPDPKASGYVFTVRRDSRGFITEIEANRKP